jgi:DNA invertase Pin-like site-specific DNA recombinase
MSRPLAYSYARFSSKKQGKGSSLHRQTQDTVAGESPESWCERNKVTLDTTLVFRDLGRSAYRGQKQRELLAFIDMVKSKRIRPGSYLLVEKVDRITRRGLDEGSDLLKTILRAGVSIVTLSNGKVYGPDAVKGLMKGWLELEMHLEAAHEYSLSLSGRVRAAWEAKRKKLRERLAEGKKVLLSAKMPPWLAAVGKGDERRAVLVPAKAATVQRIFDMAAAGVGLTRIVRTLKGDGTPPLNGGWSRIWVRRLLTDRATLGEFQPTAGGKPDGPVAENYYPAVVTPEVFYKARAGLGDRKLRYAPRGPDVPCLFSGLLKDARGVGPDGKPVSYVIAGRVEKTRRLVKGKMRRVGEGKAHRVLMSAADVGTRGGKGGPGTGGMASSFPLDVFEAAVLAMLKEVDPNEVIPPNGEENEVLTLSGELAAVEGRIAELEAALAGDGDVTALVRALRQLEARGKDVAGRLAEARLRAASPALEAWGEAKTLLDVIDQAADPEEARLRLRAVLRRFIDVVYLLVVPRGRDRLAAVQVFFVDDGHRNYLIHYSPPKSNGKYRTEGAWSAASLPPAVTRGLELDLRRRDHARDLAEALLAADIGSLSGIE